MASILASLLFAAGRAILQVYFDFANPASQLGSAAASLAAVLIWVYYTSMIVLLGAEFSKAWAAASGHRVIPELGAARTAPPPEPIEPAEPVVPVEQEKSAAEDEPENAHAAD